MHPHGKICMHDCAMYTREYVYILAINVRDMQVCNRVLIVRCQVDAHYGEHAFEVVVGKEIDFD